jgi:hypothetical protein
MSNEEDKTAALSENIEGGMVEKVTDLAGDVLTGVPDPIRKNAFKAFAQLCTAAIDIPVAHLSGIAAEKRAEIQARIKIINTGADQIANQMKMDPEYAKVAVKKYGQKIIREQINLDIISENAKQELLQLNIDKNDSSDTNPNEEISEDWLNIFEKEAVNKSSDEMRMLFGKILAGEISKPKSYSIKTIKIISQLDNRAATLFQIFCSLAVSLQAGNHIIDGRVVSIEGNAGSNSLQKYGLSFDNLNILQEYGLIISDYNSYMGYSMCVANNRQVLLSFMHQGKHFGLVLQDGKSVDDLRLHGVALSNSGKELLNIVDITPSGPYTNDLSEHFKNKGLDMIEISSSP